MKTSHAMLTVFLLTISLISFASAENSRSINILGKGIAISQSDPLDFQGIRIGIAKVMIKSDNGSNTTRIGLLETGGIRYKITNAQITSDSATGDLNNNGSLMGSFSITHFSKNDTDVWAGKLTLNGKMFNVYIIEGQRQIEKHEISDKVSDYCEAHHDDDNCRNKIEEYCKNNQDDQRCKAMFMISCRNHLDDSNCRSAIRDHCMNNSANASECRDFAINQTKAFCEKFPKTGICLKAIAEISQNCANNTEGRCSDFCKYNPQKCNEAKNKLDQLREHMGDLRGKMNETRGKMRDIKDQMMENRDNRTGNQDNNETGNLGNQSIQSAMAR